MTVYWPVVTLAVIAALWSGALPDGMEMDSTCIGKQFNPLFEKFLMPNSNQKSCFLGLFKKFLAIRITSGKCGLALGVPYLLGAQALDERHIGSRASPFFSFRQKARD